LSASYHPFAWLQLLTFLVVVAGIVLLVFWSTRHNPWGTGHHPASPTEGPLDILARRFASGEITAEEYQRARDLLGGGGKTG
jgi:uncharacterized membrane protein